MKLLGYDHGPTKAGWGLVEDRTLLHYGNFSYKNLGFNKALQRIAIDFAGLLETHTPDLVVFELQSSFRNANTSRQMCMIQGVVVLECLEAQVRFEFIRPPTLKRLVGGHGRASKAEVKMGVRSLLGLTERHRLTDDEGDGIGLALSWPMYMAEGGH